MVAEAILDFSRFEFKYVLQKTLREQVESELGYFMRLDPFVESAFQQRYFVRSLYYDDPVHSAFYDKIDGLKRRSKFRIRTYTRTADNTAPVFLEQKGREDNRVFKHRVLLAETADAFSQNQLTDKEGFLHEEPVGQQFHYERFRKQLKPVALIDYLRRPYISSYDHEFRVTFDEQLQATHTDTLFGDRRGKTRRVLPGYTVMEVKFDRTVPAWFHRIIQSYELRRVPLSKICEGMKALSLAVDLE